MSHTFRSPFLAVLLLTGVNALAQGDCLPGGVLEPLDTWQTVSGTYWANDWAIYEVTMY